MNVIRPLERRDIPQVASLIEVRLGSGSPIPSPGLERFLERTLLDHPWADPEIPSLVYDAAGRIRGFIASQVRRMRYEDEAIRLACVSHLVADPTVHKPVGALLLRRMLSGPQALSLTDTASEQVCQMWERLGAERSYVGSARWLRLFGPWSYVAHGRLQSRPDFPRGADRQLRAVSAMLDAASRGVLPGRLRPRTPSSTTEPLTPATLLEHLPWVTTGARLVPDYDRAYLDWVFDELVRKGPGEPIGAIVKQGDRVRGWFLYHLQAKGIGFVVSIAARDGDHTAIVVDHLFHHAYTRGAIALHGRFEPRLLPVLAARRCRLRPGSGMLIYSQTPEILHAIQSGRALLTQLEGEWVGLIPT